MRAVVGLLIAGAALCPACVCSSAVDLDRALLEGDGDADGDSLPVPDAASAPLDRDAGPEPCPHGWTRCTGECVDTDADPASCGACGIACRDGWICVAGACAPLCDGDDEVLWCLDRCVDPTHDNHNCGVCGLLCVAGTHCRGGICR